MLGSLNLRSVNGIKLWDRFINELIAKGCCLQAPCIPLLWFFCRDVPVLYVHAVILDLL